MNFGAAPMKPAAPMLRPIAQAPILATSGGRREETIGVHPTQEAIRDAGLEFALSVPRVQGV